MSVSMIARRKVDATLVLLGSFSTDDPEVARSTIRSRSGATNGSSCSVKATTPHWSTRFSAGAPSCCRRHCEGFGLTVAEAMWKGTPVIGGDAGPIHDQITDGENGFLVSDVEQAAERIVQPLRDAKLRRTIGKRGRETVRKRFLLTRYFEQYLDLFSSFETLFRLKLH
jgi:trehalose synthase